MKARALVAGIVVSVLLLGVAGTLYVLSGSGTEQQQYRSAIALSRQIQQLSSQWSVEIARVRSNPLADFDSLAAFIPRMARLKGALRDMARSIEGLPGRLASDINAYLSALEAKEERIERFKTGYAVVRNSTRYLPLAAANVTREAQEARDEALVGTIAMLVQDMNQYLSGPTETARARLGEELRRLREASVSHPLALANGLANLVSHAEVLLEKQGSTEKLFQKATSSDIADLTERLVGSLEFELGKQAVQSAWYERAMLALIALLALFWVGLALLQRARSAAPVLIPQSVPAAAPEAAASIGNLDDDAEPLRATLLAARVQDGMEREATAVRAHTEPEMGPESALRQEFLARCVADYLAASASRIATRMDYLRQTQARIQHLLLDNDSLLPTLEDGTDLNEEIEAAGAITASVRREMNTIADLARRFAASSPVPEVILDRDMVDLNACVEDVLRATGAGEVVSVAKRLGNIPQIFASRAEIRLLLTQVIENAVHAAQGLEKRAGAIKIDTASHDDDIRITVIDNGTGISADKRAKIFKPFHTSRDGAMGLGLTQARHLAGRYDGNIMVNSLPDQGTATRIRLPAGVFHP